MQTITMESKAIEEIEDLYDGTLLHGDAIVHTFWEQDVIEVPGALGFVMAAYDPARGISGGWNMSLQGRELIVTAHDDEDEQVQTSYRLVAG